LKSHILGRLTDRPYTGDEDQFSKDEMRTVTFIANRIYQHKVLHVNYTTYDVRRAQDSLNPRTHSDFMVLAHEDDDENTAHPYWYGRIIGIFHAYVRHTGPASKTSDAQQIDFLWVRWHGRDPTYRSGFKVKRLHRVGFIDSTDEGAFGFLDPNEIIRAVHLIPAFRHGKTFELLGPSIARQPKEEDEDWRLFYVNM
jgi:hypothetical protein